MGMGQHSWVFMSGCSSRYLRLDPIEMTRSIQVAGIAMTPNARPTFLGS